MLTQNDLEKIKTIVDTSVDQKLKKELAPIKKDILDIKKELIPMKKDIRIIKKDLRVTINLFDSDIIDLKKRTDRVEDVLNLPPMSV